MWNMECKKELRTVSYGATRCRTNLISRYCKLHDHLSYVTEYRTSHGKWRWYCITEIHHFFVRNIVEILLKICLCLELYPQVRNRSQHSSSQSSVLNRSEEDDEVTVRGQGKVGIITQTDLSLIRISEQLSAYLTELGLTGADEELTNDKQWALNCDIRCCEVAWIFLEFICPQVCDASNLKLFPCNSQCL
ncbi:hypothetical protein Tcan_08375 [Toxocara canis]|uniref:Uncharacterized protein n=1 Tax=Toxocara canis TaxID=6265 RepID=A0A0B2V354_TOXCA|nr:hypothetical protein Tcan_08375 [Toxocara canis]